MLILCARQEEHFQRNLSGLLEFWVRIDYNIDVNKKESTHSKGGCSRQDGNVLTDTAYPVQQTGQAFLFSLVSLIEKGKQRNNQTTKGHQQGQYSNENRNDFISCHERHLPSYVFRQTGFQSREATTLSWVLFLRVSTQEYCIIL